MSNRVATSPASLLDLLGPGLAAEAEAMAACGGLPVEAAAWSMLTVISAAVGHSVRVQTPVGSRGLALQTVVIAPVHAEARDVLAQLEVVYRECLRSLQGGAQTRHGAPEDPYEQPGCETSPETRLLLEEARRKREALSALEVVSDSLEVDEIRRGVVGSFDRSLLVLSLDAPKKQRNPSAESTTQELFAQGWGGLLHLDARPVHLALLALWPLARAARWLTAESAAFPWTAIDGRRGAFAALAPRRELVLAQLKRVVMNLLVRRVRQPPRVVTLEPGALTRLNQVARSAETQAAELPERCAGWLSPAVGLFLRVAALAQLIENPQATQISDPHANQAACVMRDWLASQTAAATCIDAAASRLLVATRTDHTQTDRARILDRLRTRETISLRDLRRKLPTRPPGYWNQRMEELKQNAAIRLEHSGRSIYVTLAGKSTKADAGTAQDGQPAASQTNPAADATDG